jgi:hypothetical protein
MQQKSLQQIADFIEQKASECDVLLNNTRQRDIKDIMALLHEQSTSEKPAYTYTIGELNAYMG